MQSILRVPLIEWRKILPVLGTAVIALVAFALTVSNLQASQAPISKHLSTGTLSSASSHSSHSSFLSSTLASVTVSPTAIHAGSMTDTPTPSATATTAVTSTAIGTATSTPTVAASATPCSPVLDYVPSGNGPGGSDLLGIAAYAGDDVWAVGYSTGTAVNGAHNFLVIEHWDGVAWSLVSSPTPDPQTTNSYLNGVSIVSPDDIWAVGTFRADAIGSTPVYKTLTEHWDGTEWQIVPSVDLGTSDNYFNAVTALASDDVWAVGYTANQFVLHPLQEHWDGTAWSVVNSSDPLACSCELLGVVGIDRIGVKLGESQSSVATA